MSEPVKMGILALQQEDRYKALHCFKVAIIADRNDADAWFGLSQVVDTPKEQLFCLKKVLALDPNFQTASDQLLNLESEYGDSVFDWKRSRMHILWLKKFANQPKSVYKATSGPQFNSVIGEIPLIAIERLIKDGALACLDFVGSLSVICKVSEIKQLLLERRLSCSGTKTQQLIRLSENDPKIIDDLMRRDKIVRCTEYGLSIIHDFENSMMVERQITIQGCYELLLVGKVKEAYDKYRGVGQKYYPTEGYPIDPNQYSTLERIMSACPDSLQMLTLDEMQKLRAAVIINFLWKEQLITAWAPENLSLTNMKVLTAAWHILRNAKIHEELSKQPRGTMVKASFHQDDKLSCNLCQVLDGKEYSILDFPNLPFSGCTSDTGCYCVLIFKHENAELAEEKDFEYDAHDEEEYEDGDIIYEDGKKYYWDGEKKELRLLADKEYARLMSKDE